MKNVLLIKLNILISRFKSEIFIYIIITNIITLFNGYGYHGQIEGFYILYIIIINISLWYRCEAASCQKDTFNFRHLNTIEHASLNVSSKNSR